LPGTLHTVAGKLMHNVVGWIAEILRNLRFNSPGAIPLKPCCNQGEYLLGIIPVFKRYFPVHPSPCKFTHC
jgi:hypothetical protein